MLTIGELTELKASPCRSARHKHYTTYSTTYIHWFRFTKRAGVLSGAGFKDDHMRHSDLVVIPEQMTTSRLREAAARVCCSTEGHINDRKLVSK